jgi:hypothetical protein
VHVITSHDPNCKGEVGMAELLHPAASADEMPSFMAAPGETDTLMVVMGLILVVAVVTFGLLFFRLHTLPERMAHKGPSVIN